MNAIQLNVIVSSEETQYNDVLRKVRSTDVKINT